MLEQFSITAEQMIDMLTLKKLTICDLIHMEIYYKKVFSFGDKIKVFVPEWLRLVKVRRLL